MIKMFDMVRFGKYILTLRKEQDLTQSDLADQLSITRQAVSKWEQGKSFPDVTLLPKLAHILDSSITELLISGNYFEDTRRRSS